MGWDETSFTWGCNNNGNDPKFLNTVDSEMFART